MKKFRLYLALPDLANKQRDNLKQTLNQYNKRFKRYKQNANILTTLHFASLHKHTTIQCQTTFSKTSSEKKQHTSCCFTIKNDIKNTKTRSKFEYIVITIVTSNHQIHIHYLFTKICILCLQLCFVFYYYSLLLLLLIHHQLSNFT